MKHEHEPAPNSQSSGLERAPSSKPVSKLPSATLNIDIQDLSSFSDDARFVTYMAIHRALSAKQRLPFPLERVVACASRDCASTDKTIRRCAIGFFHRLLRRSAGTPQMLVHQIGAALLCAAGHEDLQIARDALGTLCVHARRLPVTLIPALTSSIAERVSLIPLRDASVDESRVLALSRSLLCRDPEVTTEALRFLASGFSSSRTAIAGRATNFFCWISDIFTSREIGNLLRLPHLPAPSFLLLAAYLPTGLSIPQYRYAIGRVVRTHDQAMSEQNTLLRERGEYAIESIASALYAKGGINRAIREFLNVARLTEVPQTLEHFAFSLCLLDTSAKEVVLQSIKEIRTRKKLSPATEQGLQIMEQKAQDFFPIL